MMKDIQEKRIENELILLQNSTIPSKFRKINKEEYYIDVVVPYKLIDNPNVNKDIIFLIHMVANFPFNQPKVYCKTPFCFPNISDGRDLLEDIIGLNWVPSFRILDIVNKIPEFVKEFMKNLQDGLLVLVGNYYLGEKYDLALLESLPIYIKKVKEKVIIDNKEKEVNKILLMSDIFFCLFDQEKWTKNNLHLTFWSNIRSLVTIKKLIKGDTCRFFWKQKNKKTQYEMIITVENSNELVNLMLDKMSKFGINYKVSKHNLGPKQGIIPPIDIDQVEKSILEIEAKVEIRPDLELMQYLMTLYDKAVEYYSATNNPKYELYTQKIHETLKSPRIKDFLEMDNGKEVTGGREKDKEILQDNILEKEIVENVNNILINEPDIENDIKNNIIPEKLRITHVVEDDNISYQINKNITEDKNLSENNLKKIESIDTKELTIEAPTNPESENIYTNEQKGLKMEISLDESDPIDYSDDEEEDEDLDN